MLSGKRKSGETVGSNSAREYSAILVEPFKGLVEFFERIFGNDIPASDVTELEECGKRSDDIRRNEPFDRIQVYLNRAVVLMTFSTKSGDVLPLLNKFTPGLLKAKYR